MSSKISALPAASLPIAGTEVLVLVQSAADTQIASDDLTVKNIRSNATSGILQIAGPGAATTRVMTTPNANFTAARTDAAQSFTAGQTFLDNIIQGTAAKGYNFTANTPAAGMTSQLLNCYEEGAWTPTDASGAGLSLTPVPDSCFYTRIGRKVWCTFSLTFPATADASAVAIGGLPFTAKDVTSSGTNGGSISFSGFTTSWMAPYINENTTNFGIRVTGNSSLTNADATGKIFRGEVSYTV